MPPTPEDWRNVVNDGPSKRLDWNTNIETLRDMGPRMREWFLPILLAGGTIYFLPAEGEKEVFSYGWALKKKPKQFWVKIVFYFAS